LAEEIAAEERGAAGLVDAEQQEPGEEAQAFVKAQVAQGPEDEEGAVPRDGRQEARPDEPRAA